jgi:hypothetical protein
VKRSVFMLSAVALMEVLLILAALMTVMVVTTAATADTAFAARSQPGIGGLPPGGGQANPHATPDSECPPEFTCNPGANENRTVPKTGGKHFVE